MNKRQTVSRLKELQERSGPNALFSNAINSMMAYCDLDSDEAEDIMHDYGDLIVRGVAHRPAEVAQCWNEWSHVVAPDMNEAKQHGFNPFAIDSFDEDVDFKWCDEGVVLDINNENVLIPFDVSKECSVLRECEEGSVYEAGEKHRDVVSTQLADGWVCEDEDDVVTLDVVVTNDAVAEVVPKQCDVEVIYSLPCPDVRVESAACKVKCVVSSFTSRVVHVEVFVSHVIRVLNVHEEDNIVVCDGWWYKDKNLSKECKTFWDDHAAEFQDKLGIGVDVAHNSVFEHCSGYVAANNKYFKKIRSQLERVIYGGIILSDVVVSSGVHGFTDVRNMDFSNVWSDALLPKFFWVRSMSSTCIGTR